MIVLSLVLKRKQEKSFFRLKKKYNDAKHDGASFDHANN